MTLEEFVKKFEVLKEHNDQAMAIGDALGKHLLDGAPVVAYGGFLEQHYIELLSELSGIDKAIISALLYEGPSMHYYGEQDKSGKHAIEFNVLTAEDLWDFYQLCDEYDNEKRNREVFLCDMPDKEGDRYIVTIDIDQNDNGNEIYFGTFSNRHHLVDMWNN